MSDTIANLLTQIRNSQAVGKRRCTVPYSRLSKTVLAVLKDSGYIAAFEEVKATEESINPTLQIDLIPGKLHKIKRLSTPGRRMYVGYRDIPTIMRGHGTVIVSTPNGVLTGKEAKKQKVGGELICEVA